jgi:MarR family transcriptional regulator, 2-MHQ and catechol-resistance regulon repressor
VSLAQEMNLQAPIRDVYHETALNIVRTAGVLSSAAAELFRRHGLTEAQFNVLFALKYNPRDITQSDLGKMLVVTRATITSVLDKLEAKGLVERVSVPSNRRIYHLALTAKGRDLIERLEPLYRSKLHDAMTAIGESECRQVIALLEQVREQAARVRRSLNGNGQKTV